ncbi:hypothetical protein D3C84_969440 [compost metagenome]
MQADARIAALRQLLGADVRHHRQVHVQRLPLVVRRQRVDPRDALDLVDTLLKRFKTVGAVHRVPLRQHPIVFQVGVTQAVGKLVVPVQFAGPLHDRTELRAVHHMGNGLDRTIRLLHVDRQRLLVHRQRLAVDDIARRILWIELQAIQGEMPG